MSTPGSLRINEDRPGVAFWEVMADEADARERWIQREIDRTAPWRLLKLARLREQRLVERIAADHCRHKAITCSW